MIFFPKNSPQNTVHISPTHISALWPAELFLLDMVTRKIWCNLQITKFLMLFYPSLLCNLLTVRPKYFPQHLILSHLQPTFLLRYERRIVTHKHNKTMFIFLYVLIFDFGKNVGRQKILHRKKANIPWIQSTFNIFLNLSTSAYQMIYYLISQNFFFYKGRIHTLNLLLMWPNRCQ